MNKKGQIEMWLTLLAVIVFIAVAVGFTVFDTVDASHVGVKNRFGVIQGTMPPGMAYTGAFVHVYQYDLRMREMQVSMAGDQSAVDKDGQSVFATININYRLNPDNIIDAYTKIGVDRDRNLERILNIDGIIREGFKQTTSQYGSLEIFQKRQEVKEKAIEIIRANFPKEYFNLENVIVSNLDFNPAFKEAIEAKKTNEERAKAKGAEVEIEKFEADRQIEIARGRAESKKLDAEAVAYERLTLAQSEAEALRLKRKELTPLLVQNNWISQWDGALPQYIFGDSGILLNMPMPGEEASG